MRELQSHLQERRSRAFSGFLNDARLALRYLLATPLLLAISVALVVVPAALATAALAVADAITFRPNPFPQPAQLVQLIRASSKSPERSPYWPPDAIDSWRQRRDIFVETAAVAYGGSALVGEGGDRRLQAEQAYVTPSLFAVLGVAPVAGRPFLPTEANAGAPPAVVISEVLSRRLSITIGSRLVINGEPTTPVGIMPRTFHYPAAGVDIWRPLDIRGKRHLGAMEVVARVLNPAVTAPLQEAVAIAGQAIAQAAPDGSEYDSAAVLPLTELGSNSASTTAAVMVFAATLLLCVVSTLNLTSLHAIHWWRRLRDHSIQLAIGASPTNLIRQLVVTHGIVIAVSAACVAPLSLWLVAAAREWTPVLLPGPGMAEVQIGSLHVAVMLGVCALMLVCSLLPTLVAAAGLYRSAPTGLDRWLKPARGPLPKTVRAVVFGQLVITTCLLMGTALLVEGGWRLLAVPRGFDASGLVFGRWLYPADAFGEPEDRESADQRIKEQLLRVPGVASVALVTSFPPEPLQRSFGTLLRPDGPRRVADGGVARYTVEDDAFRIAGLKMLEGRPFVASDGPGTVVISQSLSRLLWPDGGAVGASFGWEGRQEVLQVVGIAADVHSGALDRPDAHLAIYAPYRHLRRSRVTPDAARAFAGSAAVVARLGVGVKADAVEAAILSVDSRIVIGSVGSIEERFRKSVAMQDVTTRLLMVLAAAAIGLTAVGVYGLTAGVVGRRYREYGIRVALGADPDSLARRVLITAAGIGCVACGVGIAIAFVVERSLRALVFGSAGLEPGPLVAVAAVVMAIVLCSAWLPARRVRRVQAATLLRDL